MAQLRPNFSSNSTDHSSWADEFLDFTSAGRGTLLCSESTAVDRLDDYQLKYLISSDMPANAVTVAAAQAANEDAPDPKRVKRILANRQSAQRSRVRKLQYISELERSVTTLQTQVSALSPRVAFLDHQRSALAVRNSHLKQRIAVLAQDKIFKDADEEALKNEIERLRQVYHHQSVEQMAAAPTPDHDTVRVEKEILS